MFSQNTINEANRHINTLTVENEELRQEVKHKNAVMKLIQDDLMKKTQEVQRLQQENSALAQRLGALGLVDIEAELSSFLSRIQAAKGVAQRPLPNLAQCKSGAGGGSSSGEAHEESNVAMGSENGAEVDSVDGFTNSEYGGSEAALSYPGFRPSGSKANSAHGDGIGEIPEITSEDGSEGGSHRLSSAAGSGGARERGERRVQLSLSPRS